MDRTLHLFKNTVTLYLTIGSSSSAECTRLKGRELLCPTQEPKAEPCLPGSAGEDVGQSV